MKDFAKLFNENFQKISTSTLYRVDLSGDTIWNIYITAMTNKHGRIFRDPASTYYTCNFCQAFIRRYGNVVAVVDGKIKSLFDLDAPEEYSDAAKAITDAVGKASIKDIFIESFHHLVQASTVTAPPKKTDSKFTLGIPKNNKRYTKEEAEKFGGVQPNEVVTFDHIYLTVPKDFVNTSSKSIDTIMSDYRASKEVFQRAMEEISLDTLELVRDLINQDSLLDGKTHLTKVKKTLEKKKEYDSLLPEDRDAWLWTTSRDYPYARFKNELIGVLCTDLSQGENLNVACEKWNKRVDPANYMRAKAPITQAQIKLAQKFVEENDYAMSFKRRFASISDIKVTEIKHISNASVKKFGSIFDNVKATKVTRHAKNKFDKVEEVSIDKFMSDILPNATLVELYLDSKYDSNVVSLTTAEKDESKSIFKWDNNYSWTYKGNLAGHSQIKTAVKKAGGNVEGVLNCRLAWNINNIGDNSDLDIWAREPNKQAIGFSSGFRKDGSNKRTSMSGQLDVDNTYPDGKIAVENITWTDQSKMQPGTYEVWVNCYSGRSHGFTVEIEVENCTYTYIYSSPLHSRKNVKVANIEYDGNTFKVIDILPSTRVSKDVCGLECNKFHKVNLMCLSPNYWGENQVGNKHYFFMLDGAKMDEPVIGFHSENLKPDIAKHRKVIEALSATCMLEPDKADLVGLGFNATVRNDVILKVKGNFERVIKVKI